MNVKNLFFVFIFIPSIVYGFEPLNTDDAGTVKAGGNQIEQYFFAINRHGENIQSDISTPGEEYVGINNARAFPFTYTRGITENIEASISATYYFEPSGYYSRYSNYVLASKWRFFEDDNSGYALAIKPTVILPASKPQQEIGLGLSALNYGVNVIASKYWENIELHLNAMYVRSPYNNNYSIGFATAPNRINIFMLSIAPVWSISKDLRLALDLGAITNPPSTEQYISHYALIAAIYSLTESVDLGISYMRTGSNYSETFALQQSGAIRTEAGVTWRF